MKQISRSKLILTLLTAILTASRAYSGQNECLELFKKIIKEQNQSFIIELEGTPTIQQARAVLKKYGHNHLTKNEIMGIVEAHFYGHDKVGKDKLNPAGFNNDTVEILLGKYRILKNIKTISEAEIRALIKEGVVGIARSPDGAVLHYKSTFDLSDENGAMDSGELFGNVVRSIRNQLVKQFPDAQKTLEGYQIYTGGDFKIGDRVNMSIASYQGNITNIYAKKYWAMRLRHPCRSNPGRMWQVDIALTTSENRNGAPVVSAYASVHYWRKPGFIGNIQNVSPSVPVVISKLLNNLRVIKPALAPGFPYGQLNYIFNDDDIQVFRKVLTDPKRNYPIVYMTPEKDSSAFAISPKQVSNALNGIAEVYVAHDTNVANSIKNIFFVHGDNFLSGYGNLRTFLTPLDVYSDSPARHYVFSQERLEGTSSDEVLTTIREAMMSMIRLKEVTHVDAQSGHAKTELQITSIEDVFAKIQLQNLRDTKQRLYESQRELHLIEKENQESGELKEIESEIANEKVDEWKKRYHQRDEYIAGLEEENLNFLAEKELLEGRVNELQRKLYESQTREVEESVFKLNQHQIDNTDAPTSIEEIRLLIEQLGSGKVVFTDKAMKTGAKFLKSLSPAQRENFPQMIFDSIAEMIPMYDELFLKKDGSFFGRNESNPRFGDIMAEYKVPAAASKGGNMTIGLTEGRTTKRNSKFVALREDSYNGIDFVAWPHIRYNAEPGNQFRIHFYLHHGDEVRRRPLIIISAIVEHYENASSQGIK